MGPKPPPVGFTNRIETVKTAQLIVEITFPSRTDNSRKTEARQHAVMSHDSS